MDRVKCSHLSFLAREDEVKCLHFLMIIMDSFLGQHNPSNYFALTCNEYLIVLPAFYIKQRKEIIMKYIPLANLKNTTGIVAFCKEANEIVVANRNGVNAK